MVSGGMVMQTHQSWISQSLANQALQLVVAGFKLCGMVGQAGALGNQMTGLGIYVCDHGLPGLQIIYFKILQVLAGWRTK